jgi:predicted Zn-dependent protease
MRDALKPVVRYLLPVAVAGLVAYAALGHGPSFSLDALKKPCSDPIRYAVVSYDARFGISRAAFEQAAAEAAALWNAAAGKTLIEASSDPDVSVNLAYDERQEAVKIGDDISVEQRAYDTMKEKVDAVRARYTDATDAYERQERTYDAAVDAYEEKVVYWNERGGAPPSEYQAIESEKARLARMRGRLGESVDAINALADTIQADVTELNALAGRLNEKVDVYNESVGHDFDQGNYVEDEGGKRITIFEFEDAMELKRVLAHEFGHALGLDHTQDPDSVMYSYNIGNSFELAETDKDALTAACDL